MSELWERALHGLREQLSSENFDTWLEPVRFDGIRDNTVMLRVPNRFFADWISAHYLDLILSSLESGGLAKADGASPTQGGSEDAVTASGGKASSAFKVHWEVDEGLQEEVTRARESEAPPPVAAPPVPLSRAQQHSDLNPKYHFKNFVVGPSNQLAHAASVAVGSDPGKRYNPLFIYGGVGLGKTHLVNAIGHRILKDRPSARILYLSAERFTNEFIWSLQNHRMNEFRDRYRNRCEVLLMDDIQFLAGREQTQEEFFHTFNALHHSDRQIVVTSDVYPQQIKEMEVRLISRFQSGMVADVQPPELDTRIAILRKKAEQEGIELDGEVALFLAQVVKSNVRELEGTLLRLAVRAELLKRPIDLELAKEALQAVLPPPDHVTSVEDIQRAVCDYFGIRLADLKSHRRHRAISFPRMVAMYLCRQRLGTSYPELGDRFGGKDHTTVISAVRKIGGLLEKDPQLSGTLDAIERKIG